MSHVVNNMIKVLALLLLEKDASIVMKAERKSYVVDVLYWCSGKRYDVFLVYKNKLPLPYGQHNIRWFLKGSWCVMQSNGHGMKRYSP